MITGTTAAPVASAETNSTTPARLMSLDAMRGFDMFWMGVVSLRQVFGAFLDGDLGIANGSWQLIFQKGAFRARLIG